MIRLTLEILADTLDLWPIAYSKNTYNFDYTGLNKGARYIDFILSHIGPHILTLDVDFFNLKLDLSKYLKTVDRNCSNLTYL